MIWIRIWDTIFAIIFSEGIISIGCRFQIVAKTFKPLDEIQVCLSWVLPASALRLEAISSSQVPEKRVVTGFLLKAG